MNNLNLNRTHQTPFSFLAEQPKKPANCNLAWIDDSFHLHGNNYFIYSCHTCQEKQIKKGKKPQADWNWGGKYE